jgi:hypothetical protein
VKVDLRAIGGHATRLTWQAGRSFVGTLLLVGLLGIALAALTYYFLAEHSWQFRVGVTALMLVESVALGVPVGSKQAIVSAVAYGFTELRLGGKLVSALFERMGVGEQVEGKLGETIARGLEYVPLAQAETMLAASVQRVAGDTAQAGWLKGKIQQKMLGAVKKYTLARFREENARHGSVELPKLRRELEATIDASVVKKVRAGLLLWNVAVLVGLPLLAAVQIAAVRWFIPVSGS